MKTYITIALVFTFCLPGICRSSGPKDCVEAANALFGPSYFYELKEELSNSTLKEFAKEISVEITQTTICKASTYESKEIVKNTFEKHKINKSTENIETILELIGIACEKAKTN